MMCGTWAHRIHKFSDGVPEKLGGYLLRVTLLRQYFPKNQPLDQVTQDDANKALAGLNHRPRKKLNYKTPWEVFCEMAFLNIDDLLGVAFMS